MDVLVTRARSCGHGAASSGAQRGDKDGTATQAWRLQTSQPHLTSTGKHSKNTELRVARVAVHQSRGRERRSRIEGWCDCQACRYRLRHPPLARIESSLDRPSLTRPSEQHGGTLAGSSRACAPSYSDPTCKQPRPRWVSCPSSHAMQVSGHVLRRPHTTCLAIALYGKHVMDLVFDSASFGSIHAVTHDLSSPCSVSLLLTSILKTYCTRTLY